MYVLREEEILNNLIYIEEEALNGMDNTLSHSPSS